MDNIKHVADYYTARLKILNVCIEVGHQQPLPTNMFFSLTWKKHGIIQQQYTHFLRIILEGFASHSGDTMGHISISMSFFLMSFLLYLQ